MEPLKHLVEAKQKHTESVQMHGDLVTRKTPGSARWNTSNQPTRTHTVRTYHLLAPVVGGQVCGALGVVGPSAVDTGHLLPVTRRVTLAVGSAWVTGEQDTDTTLTYCDLWCLWYSRNHNIRTKLLCCFCMLELSYLCGWSRRCTLDTALTPADPLCSVASRWSRPTLGYSRLLHKEWETAVRDLKV